MARLATPAMSVARSARHSTIWLAVLLSIVLIGGVLAMTLYRALPSASAPAPAVAGVRAAPDQHERHADLLALKAERAALDQYERHADRFVPKAEGAALDQYERHRYGFVSSAAPHDLSWPSRRLYGHRRRGDLGSAESARAAPGRLRACRYAAGSARAPPRRPAYRHVRAKAENAALPDALDRYLASRNRP